MNFRNVADMENKNDGQMPQALTNPDNDWVTAPWGRIGFVNEIHGDRGKVCPEFVPTQHELMLLARHWIEQMHDIEMDWFYDASPCSSEMRVMPYARRRLNRIQTAIGKEAFDKLAAEAEEKLRKDMGERAWNIFRNGTEAERKTFREEVEASAHKGKGAQI